MKQTLGAAKSVRDRLRKKQPTHVRHRSCEKIDGLGLVGKEYMECIKRCNVKVICSI